MPEYRLLQKVCGKLPQLIVFDLDGTLVDSVPDIATATDAMLVELGRKAAGVDQVRGWVGNGAEKLVQRALANSCDEALIGSLAASDVSAALAIFKQHYAVHNGRHSVLYPGVEVAVKHCFEAGIRLAIVTNKPLQFVHPLLEKLNIAGRFEIVVGGECLPLKKPHPAPLLHVAEMLGVAVADCLMVGDSRHDVEAGLAAGMPVIAVSYGYNHGEPVAKAGPNVVIDHFSELLV